jgi:hypothetical protein
VAPRPGRLHSQADAGPSSSCVRPVRSRPGRRALFRSGLRQIADNPRPARPKWLGRSKMGTRLRMKSLRRFPAGLCSARAWSAKRARCSGERRSKSAPSGSRDTVNSGQDSALEGEPLALRASELSLGTSAWSELIPPAIPMHLPAKTPLCRARRLVKVMSRTSTYLRCGLRRSQMYAPYAANPGSPIPINGPGAERLTPGPPLCLYQP